MNGIEFTGTIVDGHGTFTELHVPGRTEVDIAPNDWPIILEPGSLNVRVTSDGYPYINQTRIQSVAELDNRILSPTFEIPQSAFGNNLLLPSASMPHRGTAQVWRCKLRTETETFSCWVLRRFGSGLTKELELVSEIHLRKAYDLVNGQRVSVVLQNGNV